MNRLPFIAACLLIAGCQAALQGKPILSDQDILQQAAGPEQGARLHAELVQEMIASGRYYAALAHLEEQERQRGPSDQIRYLRADTLGRLGRHDEAQAIYRDLLNSSFAAEANHGIGLYHQQNNNDSQALSHFKEAVRLKPTDAEMRNDLGYALLLNGDKAGTRLHLATAYELSSGAARYRNNYIMALLWMGDEKAARGVAEMAEVDGKTMANLRIQAQKLRVQQSGGDEESKKADSEAEKSRNG